jgi:hypothetical protein
MGSLELPPPSRPIATNCSASPSCRSGCEIRNQRRANSRYSSLDQCKQELASVERLFRREAIRFLDTSSHSVEEISAKIWKRPAFAASSANLQGCDSTTHHLNKSVAR